ncbi:hypothetical protein BD65_2656 [Yersinia ruckeri]|uniref:winged helix-turn-helix domain-containing protein n=1 Tax=Yersinia ruckeri TaxID=29486 RepID=UPI0005ABC682|nr:hypothetical protein [Yersinia ruckeri]AJI94952.1 hypothetical protein BD65_2656 [Yersinia ruckeri]MCW6566873.1 hypothetical protein [Yersinia ruckeri]
MHTAKISRLNGNIIFHPLQRTLSMHKKEIRLSENESRLLQMLLEKTCEKKEIIHTIWESRGIIVTDSSYYKLIKQLRYSFSNIGVEEDPIMTLPRIGVRYVGTQEIIEPEAARSHNHRNISVKTRSLKTVATSLLLIAATVFIFDYVTI